MNKLLYYIKNSIYIIIISLILSWLLISPINFVSKDPLNDIINKKIIITGASLGIGKSLAIEAAKSGALEIVIASRSKEKLENVKNIIKLYNNETIIHIIDIDLSTLESSKLLIKKSIELMGNIDYLILNHITSSHYGTWLEDNQKEENDFISEMFHINTFSYIWITTEAMKYLKKTNGKIAIVSSLASHIGIPRTAIYASTKHALGGFFNSLRLELIFQKINVSITICSIGATDTEGASIVKDKLNSKLVKFDPPEYAAKAILRGTALKKRQIYHPHHQVFPMIIIAHYFPLLAEKILLSSLL
jgi:short-subunit dehydrogenase